MSTPKLRLTVKQIRALQSKHGIENLLQPSAEEGRKVASVDFLAEYFYEGSRRWDDAPTVEAIEEMDFADLFAAFQESMSPEGLVGKG